MTVTKPVPAVADPEDLDGLAAELAFAAARLARGLQAVPHPEISVSEMAMLSGLAGGLTSPAALAAREQMQSPSVTRHIKELLGRGLISRTAHGDDARRAVLAVTDEGRKALAAACRESWLAACIRGLGWEEQQALRDAVPVLGRLFPCRAAQNGEVTGNAQGMAQDPVPAGPDAGPLAVPDHG